MGRGNWFPGRHTEDCRVVYIDYSCDEIAADDSESWYWQWEYVKDIIAECLPKSFTMIKTRNEVPHHIRRSEKSFRDCGVLAYNGLFTLWVDSQSDPHHTGIGFTVNEDAPSFAKSRLDSMADAFFDQIDESLNLSVRTSAWTSSPYQKRSVAS
jgi:hypothetical protein